MDNRNTKQKITDAALELFSTQGFEATSVSQIAAEVGIRKASLYSHFASKQEILECLIRESLERYEWHSIFSNPDKTFLNEDNRTLNADTVTKKIIGQIRYILHEPEVLKGRRMLTIEQFRNPLLAKMLTKQNYTDVMKYFTGLIHCLIDMGQLSDNDEEIMASQLCLPISVWINLCDREPEKENEIMLLIERHIKQFFEIYAKDKK